MRQHTIKPHGWSYPKTCFPCNRAARPARDAVEGHHDVRICRRARCDLGERVRTAQLVPGCSQSITCNPPPNHPSTRPQSPRPTSNRIGACETTTLEIRANHPYLQISGRITQFKVAPTSLGSSRAHPWQTQSLIRIEFRALALTR